MVVCSTKSGWKETTMRRYLIITERANSNYSAYSPDLHATDRSSRVSRGILV